MEQDGKAVFRPKLNLAGHDGNIFSIMGDARKLLLKHGQKKEADEMVRRVEKSDRYYKALEIISEYVETEFSTPKQEKKKTGRKSEKGNPCR